MALGTIHVLIVNGVLQKKNTTTQWLGVPFGFGVCGLQNKFRKRFPHQEMLSSVRIYFCYKHTHGRESIRSDIKFV